MTVGWVAEISRREGEVLAAVARHRSNAQIARELHISVRTVENHVSSLLRKFGVADRRALADFAVAEAAAEPGVASIAGLPRGRDTFVGRAAVGERIVAGLGEPALVTLLGPGGVGKSRLAAAVVEGNAHRFPGGGVFVDLVGVSPGFTVQAVATALDVTESPLRSLADEIIDRLHGSRKVLVLDNCDLLVEEASGLVAALLSGCPLLTVLVTSRERLGVAGERVVAVPPLTLRTDAVRLFEDRARAVDPGFAADEVAIAEVCARLDGIPLAIELAAARIGSLGIDGLRLALQDQLRTLSGGRGFDPRHRSLRDVVGWSHDLLTDEERAVFRRLGVFAGGFDIRAAAALNPTLSTASLADVIGRLVDKSLLTHRPTATGSRWRMLETIKAFAAEALRPGGEREAVRRAHLEWAAATAAELHGRLESGWRAAFDQVAGDLRAALAAAAPEPDPVAHRLARSLAGLTFARGSFAESVLHFQAAATHAVRPEDACQDLTTAADAALAVTTGPTAYRLLLEAARKARDAGDTTGHAIAVARAVTVAARFAGGIAEKLPHEHTAALLDEAILGAAGTDDPTVAAILAIAKAWSHIDGTASPDPGPAREAVAAADRAGDPVLRLNALDAHGYALALNGHLHDAYRIAQQRLRLTVALPWHRPDAVAEIGDTFHSASAAALRTGRLPEALAIAQQARDDDPIGNHPVIACYKESMALALSGRFDEALGSVDLMWDEWRRTGARPIEWVSPAVLAAALVHGLRGDHEASGVWWRRALDVSGLSTSDVSEHLGACAAFVRARLAVHANASHEAEALVANCFAYRPPRYQTYAEAAGAELAVLAGLPDAAERIERAAASATQNAWAVACLQRATGRLRADAGALAAAVDGWAAIGARFERAATLVLLPDRADEGRAELRALGAG